MPPSGSTVNGNTPGVKAPAFAERSVTKPSCSLSPGGVGVIAQFAYEESGKEHSASALLPHLPYSQIHLNREESSWTPSSSQASTASGLTGTLWFPRTLWGDGGGRTKAASPRPGTSPPAVFRGVHGWDFASQRTGSTGGWLPCRGPLGRTPQRRPSPANGAPILKSAGSPL